MNNSRYLLALNRMNRVGPRTVAKLLKHWPQLQDMFELSQPELEKEGLPPVLAEAIATFDWKGVEEDLRWQERSPHHHLITWADPEYPVLLREIHDPPAVLYARGDLSCFNQDMVAMVGTRKPSVTGRETARHFARELSSRQLTIVSGLAAGIDAEVHQGCLDIGGKTIAVMGTGIDRVYPRAHARLAEEIGKNGLLLSEFPLKTSPIAGHFPRRNRIISGLSLATLIVEAAIRSGTLITARLAMEQNRDVLAIPGSIHNPQARGCHHLLQQGAKLVTSIEDVLDELARDYEITAPTLLNERVLASENKNLVKCIGYEVTSIDQVVVRSGLEVSEVACLLASLELQGVIQAVTGGYMRCEDERNFV